MKKISIMILLLTTFVFAAYRAIVPDGWQPYKDKLNRFEVAMPNTITETKLPADENFKDGLQLDTFLGSDSYVVKVFTCKNKIANQAQLKQFTDKLVQGSLSDKEAISSSDTTFLKGFPVTRYTIMDKPVPTYSRDEKFFIKNDVLYQLSVTHYFSDTQKDLGSLLSMSLKIK